MGFDQKPVGSGNRLCTFTVPNYVWWTKCAWVTNVLYMCYIPWKMLNLSTLYIHTAIFVILSICYRFGYTHFLHVHDIVTRKVEYFFQDVVCQYWPWCSKLNYPCPSALQMIPCLPAMHAKAHTWHCSVQMYYLYVVFIVCSHKMWPVGQYYCLAALEIYELIVVTLLRWLILRCVA